jgi:transposase
MLSFSGSLKVFVALEPCDMRKGFEELQAAVGERLKEEVRSGALFVFTNRRRTRLKILYFDGTGLWLMTKRLEQGTFFWPKAAESGQGQVEAHTGGLCAAHRWHRHAQSNDAPVV